VKNAIQQLIVRLLAYAEADGWAGYDPYDALNSKLFNAFLFLNARIPRIAVTQALKRSPINLRRLLLIPKTQNPKALALVLSALIKLPKVGDPGREELVRHLIERLVVLRSPHTRPWCWGYSFPWQTRTVLVPAGAPNLVCTSFVANALLDAYDWCGEPRCLEMAVSAAEYMRGDLYWSTAGHVAGFAYPLASNRDQVHNANLLASAFMCRVAAYSGEKRFLAPALNAARYTATRQNPDGSWYYGETRSQRWIDNFHTGFNLCALESIAQWTGTAEFRDCVGKGFGFYRNRFLRADGAVRYFHNRTYPIDIHCVAQSIITLVTLRDLASDNLELAQSVLQWALEHMWDSRGYFYYRVLRWYTIRTPYFRWSQAWMLLAASSLFAAMGEASVRPRVAIEAPVLQRTASLSRAAGT
jgi:hypothetical protein